MPTTVETLKELYVHLGGLPDEVTDVTLISEMISAIAKLTLPPGDVVPIPHEMITEIVNNITMEVA